MSNDIARVASLPAAAIATADPARARSAATSSAAQPAQPQTQPAQATAAPAPAPQVPDVAQAVERIQSYLKSVNHSLEFRIDSDSGRTVVSVRDVETGDLIRQFPSEEVLRLAQLADEQSVPLLNETV
jgi:flagellar protein FlaG